MSRISLNRAAELCHVSRRTMQRWVARGQIPRSPAGGVELEALVQAGLLTETQAAQALQAPRPRPPQILLRDVLREVADVRQLVIELREDVVTRV